MPPSDTLPDGAYAVALGTLPGLGPRSLFHLLSRHRPADAWSRVRAGEIEGGLEQACARVDVASLWSQHRRRGVGVTWVGHESYPACLPGDPAAPGVLFHLGDVAALGRWPRVAIVGTRSATRYGLGVAAQLGAELAMAGVSVVSGLALGIDGAAHEGACAGRAAAGTGGGPPVGVVAGGLDAPYPARHAGLWERVAAAGAVVSTTPNGTPLERGRFPQRNRLIAALVDVVVVVESHHSGGALNTASEAVERGRLVGAVPGSIRSPSSGGTNDLLYDGAFPVRDVSDVQTALDLVWADEPPRSRRGPAVIGPAEAARASAAGAVAAGGVGTVPAPDALAELVAAALGHDRCSVEQLARRTGLALPLLCTVLEDLSAAGRLVGEGGWWEHG